MTTRYGVKDDGSAMTIQEFFDVYDKVKLTEDELTKLKVKEEKVSNDLLKGAPPCLIAIAKQGIPMAKETMPSITSVCIVRKDIQTGI